MARQAAEETEMFPTPTRMFLTKGVGVRRHALTAFEFALRDADIEQKPSQCKWSLVAVAATDFVADGGSRNGNSAATRLSSFGRIYSGTLPFCGR